MDAQHPCPLLHHMSGANKLLSAAGNSGPPESGVTYAAVVVGPVAPNKPSRSVTPPAKGSDPCEPAVPTELSGGECSSCKQAPVRDRKSTATRHPDAPEAKRA